MPLSRMWIGMTTKNESNAGTDSSIVLIVNQGGADLLHHTFGDTSQDDQNRGQANVYEVDVQGRGIAGPAFNPSSIRVGIRGEDAWRPEHFVVWGEDEDGGRIIPLGMTLGESLTLSTDRGEGNISVPVPIAPPLTRRNNITALIVMMTTSDAKDSGTNSSIFMDIVGNTSSGTVAQVVDFPDTPQKEQEKGQANFYIMQLAPPIPVGQLVSARLRIDGDDAWRPASFFVFGIGPKSGPNAPVVPLISVPSWSFGTMSTDSSEGSQFVNLPLL